MANFLDYLDPKVPLEVRLQKRFDEVHIANGRRQEILSFLEVLKIKDHETFRHSIRVGILASQIAEFMHVSRRALLYAGLLHDMGKVQARPELLRKTENWTETDAAELDRHVMDGYRLIRGQFDFSAEIILWHHKFQPRGYPKRMPPSLHHYSLGTKALIPIFGRILSLADVFDALHRINSRTENGGLTGEMIREKMVDFHKDQEELVSELFNAGIFTTALFR